MTFHEIQQYSIATGREIRQIRTLQWYGYVDLVSFALNVAKTIEIHEPSTYRETVNGIQFSKWAIAMSEEMESFHKNQTWKLVKPPKG